MLNFPDTIRVEKKEEFNTVLYSEIVESLRKQIYKHIIRNDENSYFDLDKFNNRETRYTRKLSDNTKELLDNATTAVIEELEELGWKCKLSFGGTALFIYSTDELPESCWDDGL